MPMPELLVPGFAREDGQKRFGKLGLAGQFLLEAEVSGFRVGQAGIGMAVEGVAYCMGLQGRISRPQGPVRKFR